MITLRRNWILVPTIIFADGVMVTLVMVLKTQLLEVSDTFTPLILLVIANNVEQRKGIPVVLRVAAPRSVLLSKSIFTTRPSLVKTDEDSRGGGMVAAETLTNTLFDSTVPVVRLYSSFDVPVTEAVTRKQPPTVL